MQKDAIIIKKHPKNKLACSHVQEYKLMVCLLGYDIPYTGKFTCCKIFVKIMISIILQKIFSQNYPRDNIKVWHGNNFYFREIYFCDWAKLYHMAGFRYGSVLVEHNITSDTQVCIVVYPTLSHHIKSLLHIQCASNYEWHIKKARSNTEVFEQH